jgi:hypothetical protein
VTDTVLDRLVAALAAAEEYNSAVGVAPVAILWPDESGQWEAAIGELQRLRRVVRFGTLDEARHQGPAYWLRCVIAETVELDELPEGVPVVYLPGISRDTLRALDTVPPELAPLGALQHQCQWFTHPNHKDWTVRSLLSNKERGLGLNVAGDPATGEALVASLAPLLDQPVTRLESKHIDAGFLNTLLNPDPIRSLLNWLDDPATMRASVDDGAWSAFVHQCKHDYGFDPAAEGEIEGARRLGEAEGQWAEVWRRFRDNPSEYAGIPDRLRQAEPPELLPKNPGAWPGAAADAEDQLRAALTGLAGRPPQEARDAVLQLEATHKMRRSYVWAELGWTPLALALEHLAEIARITSTALPDGSVDDISDWYASTGWRADRAVLAAVNEVERKADLAAVEAAIIATYRPWLDAGAKALQSAVGPMANSGNYVAAAAPKVGAGEVVMFVDGLRLDVAHLLADRLAGAGLEATLSTGLAALPTVTQTSKPALVPIDQTLLSAGDGLDARRAPDGPSAGVQVLRSLMGNAKVQVLLGADDTGDPTGVAWTEAGELDRRGHDLGVRLAYEIDDEVQRIATRIDELLEVGWTTVTVVTDHGWLLMPGGLPKNEDLPVAVTDTKKGRCARIKDGAALAVPTVPWHWDPQVRIAVAPGISCFEANQTYEHGGVSPQECVVPRLAVTRGATASAGAAITNMKWRGLTLLVEFTHLPDGATIDLRSSAGDASSSIAERARLTGGQGRELLLVGDDDLEGEPAHLVVIGSDGSLILQRQTTVGQNR